MTAAPIVASGSGDRRPDATVVVPADRREGLDATVADIRASVGVDAEAVVVTSVPDWASGGPGVRVLRVPEGTPTGRLAELGMAAARGRAVTFLAPGDRIGPGVLGRMVAAHVDDTVVVAGASASDEVDLLAGDGMALVDLRHARSARVPDAAGPHAILGFWAAVAGRAQLRLVGVSGRVERTRPADSDSTWPTTLTADLELLAALAPPAEGGGGPRGAQQVTETVRAWVGRRLNAAVREDPGRHDDVVREVRRHDVRGVPWSGINEGLGRHLAVLYAFTPSLDTSALVAARRLRARGLVTDVVSQDIGRVRRTDPHSTAIAEEYVDRSHVLARRDLDLWADARVFTEETLAFVRAAEQRKGAYRSMYSRAMFAHSHVAAAAIKLRRPELPWVAEFSDPMRHNAEGVQRLGDVGDDWLTAELGEELRRHGYDDRTHRAFYEWAELVAYALADEILFTNAQQRDVMLGYCPSPELAARARERAVVEHHPIPGPELYTRVRSSYLLAEDRVHIGYFGNFYANRGLAALTEALAALPLALRDRVRLHVFTAHPEPRAQEMIERGLADVVTVVPMVGYLEHLHLASRFDALLVADYEAAEPFGTNPYLPAKAADYAGTGVPVWGVVEPGSVLSTQPLAHWSFIGDVDGAREVLLAIIGSSAPLGE